ncbi:hypothetical protein CXG81DRAFT_758, partial [Caulochytrium protostelioides]
LANLRLYQYSAVDKSPLSYYVLRPYWNWCVQWFPMTMAPNLITLIGFCAVLIDVLLILIYTPDLATPAPAWVYVAFAAGLWIYSTFDNVDGKQARRTGTSSPLGELFDHGCDALNATAGGLVQAAGLGLGVSGRTCIVLFVTIGTFYIASWENYHTKTLYLGYINGPTEGLVVSCLTMLASAVWGPAIWHQPASHWIGPLAPRTWLVCDLCTAGLLGLMLTTQLPASLLNTTTMGQALWQTIPFALFFLAVGVWLAAPGSVVMTPDYFILFAFTVGLVFGRIATIIILAHVTHMPYPEWSLLYFPVYAGALLSLPAVITGSPHAALWTPAGEATYLSIVFLWSLVAYLSWAWIVIQQFCHHLGIECLSIA